MSDNDRAKTPSFELDQSVPMSDYQRLLAENKWMREALSELSEFSPPDNSCIHVLRQTERVCVYYTIPHDSTHFVIFDSLDKAA